MTKIQTEMQAVDTEGSQQILARRSQCQKILETLTLRSSSMVFACLSTLDGRAVAHATSKPEFSPQRISAITSSLLSLSESFAKESLQGTCLHTTIAINHGTVVTVRIPSSTRNFSLSVCTDLAESMAVTMRWTLDAATNLAKVMEQGS